MVPDILSTWYVEVIHIFYYHSGEVFDPFGWPHHTDEKILDSVLSKFALTSCSRRAENLKHSWHDLGLYIMSPWTQAGWHPGKKGQSGLPALPPRQLSVSTVEVWWGCVASPATYTSCWAGMELDSYCILRNRSQTPCDSLLNVAVFKGVEVYLSVSRNVHQRFWNWRNLWIEPEK